MAPRTTTQPDIPHVADRSSSEHRLAGSIEFIDDPIRFGARRTPPVPTYVQLSRLITPNVHDTTSETAPPGAERFDVNPSAGERPRKTSRTWADSAGRPLFRIGLAAIAAALIVGIVTFGPGSGSVVTVESPDAAIHRETRGHLDEADTGEVLEVLVRQSADQQADLSIVGTATAGRAEIRWTATVRNAGPETAQAPVTVVQTIASNFELLSVVGEGWDCEHRRDAGTITCQLDQDLDAGQRRRLGLVTSDNSTPGTNVVSTMSVVATTPDPDFDNNTVDVTAVSASEDRDGAADRSRSSGAAGQAESSGDTDVNATGTDDADGSAGTTLDELPRTGSGLAVALGGIGFTLCLTGRRLTAWSDRAQTRSLLVAANIG